VCSEGISMETCCCCPLFSYITQNENESNVSNEAVHHVKQCVMMNSCRTSNVTLEGGTGVY